MYLYIFGVTTKLLYNNFFSEKLLAIEIKKTQRVMLDFWFDYIKPKYKENQKLCYMDTNILIVFRKTDEINKSLGEYVERRFGTLKYELN